MLNELLGGSLFKDLGKEIEKALKIADSALLIIKSIGATQSKILAALERIEQRIDKVLDP